MALSKRGALEMDKQITLKKQHEQSQKEFPFLKLDDDEYVKFAFSRTRVCLVAIFGGVIAGLILLFVTFALAFTGQELYINIFSGVVLYALLGFMILAAVIIATVALTVYRGNRLFVTNKHVIQTIMKSPFATSVNMIDLPSIEDASYREEGLLRKIFHYGTFRLATVGDETTYTFEFASVSPEELKEISDLITDAKKSVKAKKG